MLGRSTAHLENLGKGLPLNYDCEKIDQSIHVVGTMEVKIV